MTLTRIVAWVFGLLFAAIGLGAGLYAAPAPSAYFIGAIPVFIGVIFVLCGEVIAAKQRALRYY